MTTTAATGHTKIDNADSPVAAAVSVIATTGLPTPPVVAVEARRV